jgi:propanol-preferring alcohol dehydrogenase
MKAAVIVRTGMLEDTPLEIAEFPEPTCRPGEVLIKIAACGVCHTEIDQIEGRLQPKRLPIIPGHQIVGVVADCGPEVRNVHTGDRVGVTWLGRSCGKCRFCTSDRENLCDDTKWTGYDIDGGYAEFTVADAQFVHRIPDSFADAQAAPLLCAGVIGYRTVRIADIADGDVVGVFGFGSSAHIVVQILRARYASSPVYVFTRGQAHKDMAIQLGAAWVGGPDELPPQQLDCAMDFTPVGTTVRRALEVSRKGAKVIINAIRKETPVPELDYGTHLWGERQIRSVANVTADDARRFLPLAEEIGIETKVEEFAVEQANEALLRLKNGQINGAAVLVM